MPEPPLEALDKAIIGDIYRSHTAYERLVELCDSCGPRFAGTAGEQRAATLLAQWLAEAGLAQVQREPFGYLGWRRGESRLEIVQPTAYSLAALALPHCPPGDIEAELCSVGGGEADDYRAAGAADGRLQGKVLLCAAESSGPSGQPPSHRRLKYGRAVTAGAAAFLYYNQNPGGLAVTGSLATRKPAPIPGLGLAYEDGATLLRLLERGPVRVRLHVTAAFPEVESANVLADLPADPTSPHGDELLLAGAHYDSHDIAPGALDNGTGVVIILEAARALAAAYRAAGRAPGGDCASASLRPRRSGCWGPGATSAATPPSYRGCASCSMWTTSAAATPAPSRSTWSAAPNSSPTSPPTPRPCSIP